MKYSNGSNTLTMSDIQFFSKQLFKTWPLTSQSRILSIYLFLMAITVDFFWNLSQVLQHYLTELLLSNYHSSYFCSLSFSTPYEHFYTDSQRESLYIVFTPAFSNLEYFSVWSFFFSVFVCSHFFGPVIEKINQSTFHQSRNSNFLNIRARKILKTVLEISDQT